MANHIKKQLIKRTQHQNGAALLIALILLFVISVMGGIAMQTSTLDYQITTNAIESRTVYQVTESVTEFALNNDANLVEAFDSGVGTEVEVSMSLVDLPKVDSSATLEFMGSNIVPGSSIGLFEGLRYRVQGSGSINEVVEAGIAQGAICEVPAH